MDFEQARQVKFDKGREEHGHNGPFDADHVAVIPEMKGEILDLYNYASLLDDEVLKTRVQLWCRDIWQELEDMG